MLLKQSATFERPFQMFDSADHVTGKTGRTVTVTLSKNGGAFAAAGGTVTELTNGWYKIALTTTDTNTVGALAIRGTATDSDELSLVDQVIVFDLADPDPDVNVVKWLGTAVATPTTGGVPEVDVTHWKGAVAWDPPTNFGVLSITAGGLVDITQAAADKAWNTAVRTLTSFGTLIADIWGYQTSLMTVVGSIGKFLVDFVTAIKAKTDLLFAGTPSQTIKADMMGIAGDSASATKAGRGWHDIISGTVSGSPTTTSIPCSDFPASLATDGLKDRVWVFSDDTATVALRGQARLITAYNGGTKTMTVVATTTTPAVGDKGNVH